MPCSGPPSASRRRSRRSEAMMRPADNHDWRAAGFSPAVRAGGRLVILLASCMITIGCGKKDIAPKPVASSPAVTLKGPPKPTTPNLPAGTPEFTLSANDFYAEYTKPNSLAHLKYRGKLIELSGTVGKVGTSAN